MKYFATFLLLITTTASASEFFFQPASGKLSLSAGFVQTSLSFDEKDVSTPGNPTEEMSYTDLLIDLKLAYSINDFVTFGIETGLGAGVRDNEDNIFDDETSYIGLDTVSLNSSISLPLGAGKVLLKPEMLIGLEKFDCDADDDCNRTFGNTAFVLGLGYEVENNQNTYGTLINYAPYTSDFKFDNGNRLETESGFEGVLFFERQFTKRFLLGFKYTYQESSIIPNLTREVVFKGNEVVYSSLGSYMRLNLGKASSLTGGLNIGAITDEDFQDLKITSAALATLNFSYRHTF